MSKRSALTNLTHDNWDAEEEPEEEGVFKKASEEQLAKRVISKARRRVVNPEPTSMKSVFGGFSGFSSSTSLDKTQSASQFSFLSKLGSTISDTNITSNKTTTPTPMYNFSSSKILPEKTITETITISDDEKSNKSTNGTIEKGRESSEYLSKLKGLNESLLKWVTKHITENPLCILTPIFKDYDSHLKSIKENNKEESATTTNSSLPSSDSAPAFNWGSKPSKSGFATTNSTGFSFGTTKPTDSSILNKTDDKNKNKMVDIFKSTTSKEAGEFVFTPQKAFTFANVQTPAKDETDKKDDNDEDDEDQPPIVKFTPVEEKGSIYSKRCKVFIKKDGNYADCGVGTLHLNPVKDTSKTQLLVRADTVLGNILVNVMLTESMPIQKMKNNILLVCVPTPDAKPSSVLIRFQNEAQTDETLEKIKSCIPSKEDK